MKVKKFESSDTNVSKFVFEFEPKNKNLGSASSFYKPSAIAEAVLYRYESYKKRTVICCSVQSGCPVGCTFCGTGKFFIRNLTSAEIFAQVQECLSTIDCNTDEIEKFQIMFMSMGEPFLCDSEQFHHAIRRIHHEYPNADLLVSTSAPQFMINRLAGFISLCNEIPKIGLQFSIHESTDEARALLIPTKTSTLRQIAAMGETWAAYTGRKPFFNYCVHENNNKLADANRLAKLFNPKVWEATLSVICEKEESVKSSMDRQLDLIKPFTEWMLDNQFSLRVFNPAGQDDIGGGCGQLWYFQEWLKQNKIK